MSQSAKQRLHVSPASKYKTDAAAVELTVSAWAARNPGWRIWREWRGGGGVLCRCDLASSELTTQVSQSKRRATAKPTSAEMPKVSI